MLAAISKTPELALSENESEQLASAAAGVARHYNISASQKALDWGNFALVLGVMYGPRFVMITQRHKDERQEKRQAQGF